MKVKCSTEVWHVMMMRRQIGAKAYRLDGSVGFYHILPPQTPKGGWKPLTVILPRTTRTSIAGLLTYFPFC